MIRNFFIFGWLWFYYMWLVCWGRIHEYSSFLHRYRFNRPWICLCAAKMRKWGKKNNSINCEEMGKLKEINRPKKNHIAQPLNENTNSPINLEIIQLNTTWKEYYTIQTKEQSTLLSLFLLLYFLFLLSIHSLTHLLNQYTN